MVQAAALSGGSAGQSVAAKQLRAPSAQAHVVTAVPAKPSRAPSSP